MTASHPDPKLPRATLLALLALATLGAPGCRTPGAAPLGSAFDRNVQQGIAFPDVADHTAAELAADALVSERAAAHDALQRVESIDRALLANGELPTGLSSVAHDLVNATLDDPRRYREASRELLRKDDLDPVLRSRLELVVEDDPLLLARARMRDSYVIKFGRAFNALAEPVGTSLMNTSMAPYKIGRSLINYAIAVYGSDPLPLQERQALAHWKTFLSQHPDSPQAPLLEIQVTAAESEWLRTQYRRSIRAAEKSLADDQIRLALVYSDRALRYEPEDRYASELRDVAAERLERQRANRDLSLASGPATDIAPEAALTLTHTLLLPDGDLLATADGLLAEDPNGPLADEAKFALAIARRDAGAEDSMWELIQDIAGDDGTGTNMARHAAALYRDPEANAYHAFERARRRNLLDNALWVMVGPYYRGVPDRGLPQPLAWVMDMPSVAESVSGSPVRLIQLPWLRSLPAANQAAHHGRRYLTRHPNGEHAAQVSRWVEDFEKKRGNWVGAYQVAEVRPGVSVEELDAYREQAAEQALAAARHAEQRDLRLATLRNVAQEFADTDAGHAAGLDIRNEISDATQHTIRISRGFFVENPEVAGPAGAGLRPELLDDDAANGELHPRGMELQGGDQVAFYYLGPSGDPDDPPLMFRDTADPARLARIVSSLEEAAFENILLDDDEAVEPDAQRDVFIERTRLGLDTDADVRAAASADYSYRGAREKYGRVRSRESILPFDLVFKGSLGNMSFGAFPRIRQPRETPDAILYK